MSKRIMNEVMTLADKKIFYQDTDSMHIKQNDVKQLAIDFKNKYGRELIGEKLGQFHSDFKSSKLNQIKLDGEEQNPNQQIYSIQAIFLGKKSYIDILTTDRDLEHGVFDFHVRMKGVTAGAVRKFNDPEIYKEIKDRLNPLKLFQELKKGKTLDFDLTYESVKFKQSAFSYQTLQSFDRRVSFQVGIFFL